MSWEVLCGDVQLTVLSFAVSEAACYFVCTVWRDWLLSGNTDADWRYLRLVDAGLRLALGRGEGSYYLSVLASHGRKFLQFNVDLNDRQVGWAFRTGLFDTRQCEAEDLYPSVSINRLINCTVSGGIGGFVCTRFRSAAFAPDVEDSQLDENALLVYETDPRYGGTCLQHVHNQFLQESRWLQVYGAVSTDVTTIPYICVDHSHPPTETPASLSLGAGGNSVALYPPQSDLPLLPEIPRRPFLWEGFTVEGDSAERREIANEELWCAFQGARVVAAESRIPGSTVTESAEDAFQADDLHEMMKILMAQDLELPWDDLAAESDGEETGAPDEARETERDAAWMAIKPDSEWDDGAGARDAWRRYGTGRLVHEMKAQNPDLWW